MAFEKRTDLKPVVPKGVLTGGDLGPEGRSITIAEGSGAYVRTTDGEEFIDYKLGSGPMLVGHAHPHVTEAIQAQAERGTTFYAPNEVARELADRIADAVPCAEAIQLFSTGTEATYQALRVARAYTGRGSVLKFEGAYHGWHDVGLVSSNHAGSRLLDVEPPAGTADTAGMAPGSVESVVTAPFNDLERTAEIIADHADDLAAVIVEPVMRVIAPREGFLEELRDLCDEHGVVLIFDEVVTGFRLALGGAQEYFGVEPDLATYGKPIGGGTAVSALCGDRDVMDVMRTDRSPEEGGVQTRGTMNGNPLGAAAGLATLDVLEREGTYRALNGYGERLGALFEDVLADSSFEGIAVGEGAIVDYVITDQDEITNYRDLRPCDSETKQAIDTELFEQGILKRIGGKVYLSTEHGDEEFERTEEAFKEAVDRVDQ